MDGPGFVTLPKATILAWLASLVRRGGSRATREGVTVDAVAIWTGIPKQSLKWLAHGTGKLNGDRQRCLSKTIAMIENGQLVFETRDGRKVPRVVHHPKPLPRYQVSVGAAGVKLSPAPRPPEYRPSLVWKNPALK